MNKPTGKLAFAYATIARLEARVAELEAAQPASEPVASMTVKRTQSEARLFFGPERAGLSLPSGDYMLYATPQPAAKPAQAEPVSRDGWKLVPVEPTEKMIGAIYGGGMANLSEFDLRRIRTQAKLDWASVLAASPTQPRPQPLTSHQKFCMWRDCTIELASHENCYLRGIADAEQYHGIKPAQEPTE
jgi:hypothetical protein